jgi:hypothetical protein
MYGSRQAGISKREMYQVHRFPRAFFRDCDKRYTLMMIMNDEL